MKPLRVRLGAAMCPDGYSKGPSPATASFSPWKHLKLLLQGAAPAVNIRTVPEGSTVLVEAGRCLRAPSPNTSPAPRLLPGRQSFQGISSGVNDSIGGVYTATINCIISQPPEIVPRLIKSLLINSEMWLIIRINNI